MPVDWERWEERGARWANILALVPGSYGSYVLWQQRHPGGGPLSQYPGATVSAIAFAACILIGALLNMLRARGQNRRPAQSPSSPSPPLAAPQAAMEISQQVLLRQIATFQRQLQDKEARLAGCLDQTRTLQSQIDAANSTLPSESAPLIYPQFTDARSGSSSFDKKEHETYFTVVNRGGSDARNIVMDPIEMDGKIVQFWRHRLAAPLLPKREAYFYPDVVTKDNRSVTEREKDLFHLFCLDYLALGDSTICEATKPVRATYQDSLQNLFEVTCELVFDPLAHGNVRSGQPSLSPVICTRNHKFRRIAGALPVITKSKE